MSDSGEQKQTKAILILLGSVAIAGCLDTKRFLNSHLDFAYARRIRWGTSLARRGDVKQGQPPWEGGLLCSKHNPFCTPIFVHN
jgi:hypothetical protein